MRLDQYLFLKKYVSSRTKAQEMILRGEVKIKNQKHLQWLSIFKPSFQVDESENIEILIDSELAQYVSRSALKLAGALEQFHVLAKDLVCLDVGQSTGGFTQVLLNRGARRVIGVEVGQGQLAPSLKDHPKVKLFEKTKIQDFINKTQLKFDLIVVDVSFVSGLHFMKELLQLAHDGTHCVYLYKPQFECGAEALNSNGVVTDLKLIEAHCSLFIQKISSHWELLAQAPAHLPGRSGNQESVLYLKPRPADKRR